MSWLIFVAIAVVCDSIRIFIDNYTSDVYFKGNGAVSQKLFYGYFWIIAGIIFLIATGFNFIEFGPLLALIFFFSGFITSLAGIPYYRALEIEDSTNLGIFIQLSPILYLIFGWFLLGDTFLPIQLIAFCIILAAPILIVATARKRSRKVKLKAILYASIYVLLAVIGNIIFVKVSTEGINYPQSLALVFLGSGTASLTIVYLINRKWRKRFYIVLKKNKNKILIPLVINAIVSLTKTAAYRTALVTAPAIALASVASDSVEPIVIFFMGIVLTIIWPKFGREKLNKKTVLVHLIATVLVVIGIVLLQLPNM